MLSLREAAKRIGKGKSTLQREAKTGRVSYGLDEKGRYQFDEAELARVYPDAFRPINGNGHDTSAAGDMRDDTIRPKSSRKDNRGQAGTPEKSRAHAQHVAILELKLDHLEERIATIRDERERERQHLLDEIEHLRSSLSAADEQRAGMTKLLEDKRDRKNEPVKKNWFLFGSKGRKRSR